jgi:hypothetical protein
VKFTNEQIDCVKHCVEHFELLIGGRRHSKTIQIIEQLQTENQQLKSTLEEIREYIRDCCNMDVKIVNLHFDNAQNEMSAEQVDDLLQIIDKSIGE